MRNLPAAAPLRALPAVLLCALLAVLLCATAPPLHAAQPPPAPGAAAAPSGSQAASPADSQTDSNVLAALGTAKSLSDVVINTNTVNGVVTLSGVVHDPSQKELAEVLAAHADGVKSVVNNLQIGVEQKPCDPNKEQLLSDGTCAPLDSGPAPEAAPQPPPKPLPTGPMLTVDVDQDCRVLELGANGKEATKERYRFDPVACNLRGPKHVQTYVDRIDSNGRMKRVVADIIEQTFTMGNGTNSTIMYLVHVPLRKSWSFDSDPPPAEMINNTGMWRVIVQPGETVRLSVGQRHEH